MVGRPEVNFKNSLSLLATPQFFFFQSLTFTSHFLEVSMVRHSLFTSLSLLAEGWLTFTSSLRRFLVVSDLLLLFTFSLFTFHFAATFHRHRSLLKGRRQLCCLGQVLRRRNLWKISRYFHKVSTSSKVNSFAILRAALQKCRSTHHISPISWMRRMRQ